jgi:hypothetical protein
MTFSAPPTRGAEGTAELMPQLHLDPGLDLHQLRVDLVHRRDKGWIEVTMKATTRNGTILRMLTANVVGFKEAEEVPIAMYESALGFLFSDSREAVELPMRGLKERRNALRKAK